MKKIRCISAKGTLAGLLALSFLNNCSLPTSPPAGGSRNRAFILHQPAPADSQRLRLAVKDLIDIKGMVTSAGSEYLASTASPAARDAECLKIARERGVKIVGKTNLSEFAMGTSGMNEYFGTPRNPVVSRRRLIPGGSSSGSAVAVAAGMAEVALGTDTAGSIRVPAACCGILGLKTTFGLVSLKGVFPLSPTHLDTVGPMARDVKHLVKGMDLLQRGFAEKYAAAMASRPSARSIKIGRLYIDGTDPAIDRALDEALAAKGFQIVVLDQAFKTKWRQAHKDGNSVALADGWLSNRKYLGQTGVTAITKAALVLGDLEHGLPYAEALNRRAEWQRTLRQVFRRVDFIALPTLQILPPRVPLFGTSALFEARMLAAQNTAAVNFAGYPALAVPIPMKGKNTSPASLQLVGRKFSEAEILNAGRLMESKP